MTDAPFDKRKAIIDALMRLASARAWSEIEITDIAQEAGVTLAEFRDLFPSKGAVLGGLSRQIDRKVLEETTDDLAGEPARERIFDVIMRRFDALEPYKESLRRISRDIQYDPLSMTALHQVAVNSMRFMLAAAGIATEGPLGTLKLQGAVLVYTNTMRTWLDDDDPALAKTMARLDRELRRGERVMEGAEDLRRLTAPLRGLGRALLNGRRSVRRERRGADEGDVDNPAAAI
ncbi:TetR/AcrR family transcriptional regulator [Microvirga solisilvae]|uniref:TetR/AcrR family transcriptional regulator n=1 Tax=Microvirga solisilvae TaxID=2919498 RepID=UPI001FAF758A|nr:TetR/AcrR family transcriptional regulator [Microvirga solisilvae]